MNWIAEGPEPFHVSPQCSLADIEPVGQLLTAPAETRLQQREEFEHALARVRHTTENTAYTGQKLTGIRDRVLTVGSPNDRGSDMNIYQRPFGVTSKLLRRVA